MLAEFKARWFAVRVGTKIHGYLQRNKLLSEYEQHLDPKLVHTNIQTEFCKRVLKEQPMSESCYRMHAFL